MPDIINIVSPMPPKPNGIADYCYAVCEKLMQLAPLRIISDDPFAEAPGGLIVHDPEQTHRYAGTDDIFNYQIGNNPDHGFVLKLLRCRPGVVTLHDLHLLYLYEMSGASKEVISDYMISSHPKMGAVWSMHQKMGLGGNRTRHSLFNFQEEIIDCSQAVIVHSAFARKLIQLKHGEKAAAKVKVIPHFAPKPDRYVRGACRAALGMPEDEIIILTSGFATKAKRLDWVVAVLDDVIRSGRKFRWIHAGKERPSEFALTDEIRSRKALWACSIITGYLPESDLDLYIGAADIMINLRFPSVGESSGTLARSYAAGNCCIVSDTAGYSEIPRDCVTHIPLHDVRANLFRELVKLIDNRELRQAFGARVRRWAATELSLEAVAQSYLEVFASCKSSPRHFSPPVVAPGPRKVYVELVNDHEMNLKKIETALNKICRSGALVIRYSEDRQIQEFFSRRPLDELLARRGLTASDIDVLYSGDGTKQIVVGLQTGL